MIKEEQRVQAAIQDVATSAILKKRQKRRRDVAGRYHCGE
jgi:hypothetical protein